VQELAQLPPIPAQSSTELRSRLERVRRLELRIREKKAGSRATPAPSGDTAVVAPVADAG